MVDRLLVMVVDTRIGAGCRDRTYGLMITSHSLYQLS